MAVKKLKKDFDKDKMYSKIMPTVAPPVPEGPPRTPEPAPLDSAAPALTESVSEAAPLARYLLRNYMEDIVLEKVGHTMTTLRACTCEKCKKDVMAHALNELPSAYMALDPQDIEDVVGRLRANVEVKVTSALVKAVQKVKQNPPHLPENRP